MPVHLQCVVVFLLALVTDVVWAGHIRALVANDAAFACGTVVVIHVMGFWSQNWFVDEKCKRRRWALTLAGALGAAAGTALVIWFFKGD